VTNEALEILSNREIIAINQDPVVGTSIAPFRWGVNVCAPYLVLHLL
jgi:alpha-galactosidase